MREFLHGWPQKLGVVTLGLAIPFQVAWRLIWNIGRELLFGIARFFYLATFLIWGPLFLFLLLTEIYFLPSELLFKRRMRKAGRYIPPAELRHSVAVGTLILDGPTFSWGISRLWYTPDDVLAISPVPSPETEEERLPNRSTSFRWHPFDRWCCNHYLSQQTGCAKLVGVWHSSRLAEHLGKALRLNVVHSWSGGELLEEFMEQPQTKPN